MSTTTISNEVLSVLEQSTIEGKTLQLNGQLERKLYLQVDTVLKALGGKWNTKIKAHLFDRSAADVVGDALSTGTYTRPKDIGFYETPQKLACELVLRAQIKNHHWCLEPSAGRGAIADKIAMEVGKGYIRMYEKDDRNAEVLRSKGYALVGRDFLQASPHEAFDRVVMNPPFENLQDIDHVLHAYAMLNPDGRLVSVMSAGASFRLDKKAVLFRELVAQYGTMEPLPEGSFKESGTMVRTVVVVLDKPIHHGAIVEASVRAGKAMKDLDHLVNRANQLNV